MKTPLPWGVFERATRYRVGRRYKTLLLRRWKIEWYLTYYAESAYPWESHSKSRACKLAEEVNLSELTKRKSDEEYKKAKWTPENCN